MELDLCAPSAPAARFGAYGALGAGILNSGGNLSAVTVVFFVFGYGIISSIIFGGLNAVSAAD